MAAPSTSRAWIALLAPTLMHVLLAGGPAPPAADCVCIVRPQARQPSHLTASGTDVLFSRPWPVRTAGARPYGRSGCHPVVGGARLEQLERYVQARVGKQPPAL